MSKPAVMNRNFELKTKEEIRARNPQITKAALEAAYTAEKSRVQIHHLIPDELVQDTELGRAAQKAGYNLDEASNLKGMPRNANDRTSGFDTEHRGSHPKYTKQVKEEIEKTTERLKLEYKTKTLDKVPPKVIEREMKRIKTNFVKKLSETTQVSS